jgi:hypothetical protein
MNGIKDTIKANVTRLVRAKNFMILLAIVQTLFSGLYFFKALHSHKQVELFYQSSVDSLKSINERYEKQTEAYQEKEQSLTRQLREKDSLLTLEKSRLQYARTEVHSILNSNWTDISVEQEIDKCDSLRVRVVEMENEQEVKDTLIGSKIFLLTSLNFEKDKQIESCNLAFVGMKLTLEQSISDNKNCMEQFDKWAKKFKRRNRILGTLAVAGITVASGIIIQNHFQQ